VSSVRRPCVCRAWIEAEDEPLSITHAVRVHQEQPEHRDFMKEVEEREAPPIEVPIRWETATLRRVA
jgi:hypothetical protein